MYVLLSRLWGSAAETQRRALRVNCCFYYFSFLQQSGEMICPSRSGMPSSGTHHSGGSNLQFESHLNVPKRTVG
jgi:hypothetical protein